ncbi:hypothetical protein [Mesorhizobium ventifaucium]|uniref:Uncharacterized protein n=1 Tax=Mesorhizobium ventifaucium TaxID=666020 RepID=A0ABM9DSU9_9HYPH|nr:hypothetical protein [Mesorhizobium ventifaucium]CAH2399190.1 hypothetical protein MES4922_210142 [Mesorhizobium ventifaucium]
MTIDKSVNYELRQYALWVEACVNEHGGSAALASWEQIEKVVNAHGALVAALETARASVAGEWGEDHPEVKDIDAALALARGEKS